MSAPLSIVPVADVHVDPGLNARSDDQQELVALRDSIARHGILQPLVVHARDEGGVWLVAGHRRLAAAKAAGLEEVPAFSVAGERLELTAVENLQRVPLSPLEEARAFQALADAGQSTRGIAKALGVASRRVTERLAILELTEAGQNAAGEGRLPLSAVGTFVELTALSGALADHVLAFALGDDNVAALGRDPGWLIARSLALETPEVSALGWLPLRRRVGLDALGVEDADLVALAATVARATFAGAGVRVDEHLIAQAVQARCAWSDSRGAGVISRAWLAEQAPAAIRAELAELEAEHAQRTSAAAASAADPDNDDGEAASAADADPGAQAGETRAGERAQAAEDRRRAAGVNDELAAKLLKGLASASWDRDSATFIAHTLLERGTDTGYGSFTNTAVLAAQGLRYLLSEFRDEVPAAKPGGAPKVSYPDPREGERRFWAWFERASTPEEMLGRMLVAYAAAAHAREEVVARSQRHGRFRPSEGAAKAFERICRRHLPAGLKRFAAERADRERADGTKA